MDDTDSLLTRHRLNVGDYHRMAEAGILGEDDRVELIDGELIDMAPIGQGHAGMVNALNHALFMAFGGRAIVSVQNPLRLDPLNEPQPDVVILPHARTSTSVARYPDPLMSCWWSRCRTARSGMSAP